jgi:hypothetical protein
MFEDPARDGCWSPFTTGHKPRVDAGVQRPRGAPQAPSWFGHSRARANGLPLDVVQETMLSGGEEQSLASNELA